MSKGRASRLRTCSSSPFSTHKVASGALYPVLGSPGQKKHQTKTHSQTGLSPAQQQRIWCMRRGKEFVQPAGQKAWGVSSVSRCQTGDYRGLSKTLLSGAQQQEEKLWVHTTEKKKMRLDARRKKFYGEGGQTLEMGPERCGISVLGSSQNSVCWGSEQAHLTSHLHLPSQWTLLWGSTGAPEGPFQPKPFHDEFNCSLLSKPFKTPVQAVRGLLKITWKPPSRDRENPIKKSKSPKSQSCTKLPIYSNTTRFWCFCEQGVWLQTSKCSEQPHIYMDGNSLLSHQPEYRACQEKAPDDCMG